MGLSDACTVRRLQLSASCEVEPAIACYRVECDIPGLGLQSVDALRLMCKADQIRMCSMLQAANECEAAIVVSAAHAEPVAVAVETEQRHDDQIQIACGDEIARARNRFRDTEAVWRQTVARPPAEKPEPARKKRVQYRQETLLVRLGSMLHEAHRTEFTLDTEVGGDALCANKSRMFQNQPCSGSRCFGPRLCRKGEASMFEMLAEPLLISHWRSWVEASPACAGTRRHP